MTVSAPKTLIDALQDSFAGALRSPDGIAAPVALLWTDADGQWRPLIPTLMKAVPELYVLGPFAPEERQGPVIWLKCIIERSLPDVSPPPGVVPILYLPNVSRQDLRAGGDCPPICSPSSSSNIAARFGISATVAIGRWKPSSRPRMASGSTSPRTIARATPCCGRWRCWRPSRSLAFADAGWKPTISTGWPSAIPFAICSAG